MNNNITAPSIYIENAHLAFDGIVLFDQLNLTLTAGKLTALLGPSGVGKTTLLRMIANLIKTNQHEAFQATIRFHPSAPSQIAYLAQDDLLLPWFNALDNALLGSRLRGDLTKEKKDLAQELFQQVGLMNAEKKYPHQLSGGMRQRVALVRTLLEDKPIVLMDEPFSSLDAITRFQLQTLASALLKNRTVFLVTHDPLEALRLADEIYILQGKPAVLHSAATLTSGTPRDPSDPEVIHYQAKLFHALIEAKDKT